MFRKVPASPLAEELIWIYRRNELDHGRKPKVEPPVTVPKKVKTRSKRKRR
jgi:hypothetical protein